MEIIGSDEKIKILTVRFVSRSAIVALIKQEDVTDILKKKT